MSGRVLVARLVTGLALVAVAGCGAESSSDATSPAVVADTLEAPVDSAEGDAGAAGAADTDEENGSGVSSAGTATATDDQGYQIQLAWDIGLDGWTLDPSTRPPGEALAIPSTTTSLTVTNLTPQRETVTPGLALLALYPAGSRTCASVFWDGMVGGMELAAANLLVYYGQDYCALTLTETLYDTSDALVTPPTLGPDEAVAYETSGSVLTDDEPPPLVPDDGSGNTALLTELDAPAALAIRFDNTAWSVAGGCAPAALGLEENGNWWDRHDTRPLYVVTDPHLCAALG